MLTHKMIRDDSYSLVASLRHAEMEIPSFWQCLWPGLLIMILMFSWGFYIGTNMAFLGYTSIGVMQVFVVAGIRGKSLSIPNNIKQENNLLRFVRNKTRIYISIFVLINLGLGLLYKSGWLYSGIIGMCPIASLVLLWITFGVDLGRLDLSIMQAAMDAWHSGQDIDAAVAQANTPSRLTPTEHEQ
ncbi:hypothetical protein BTN33_21695 [Aeromonas veronii]|uniref:hypothetical protein n=1 Tax=Aeromonas veronii TaxID=654 RepID=UPI00094705BA|nr:hypothetical protein [Aeromonas veronii]OLF56979.1 hypothetical protein BTN33_21695 [Aeromonas veronii]